MPLNERLEKKLRKLLAKADLKEEEIDEVVDEIKSPKTEEDAPDGNNPVESEVPPSDENKEEVKEEIEEKVEEKPDQEVAPNPQPETDGSLDNTVAALVEGLNVPPAEEVPPVADPAQEVAPVEPVAAPELDPKYQELVAALEEQKKANEGLNARVKSLEDALRAAGILEGNVQPQVGFENPNLPESINGQGDILGEVLSQINRK